MGRCHGAVHRPPFGGYPLAAPQAAPPRFCRFDCRGARPCSLHMQMWVVTGLTRHLVTRKVDVAKLSQSLPQVLPSWPHDDAAKGFEARMLRARLVEKMQKQHTWTLVACSLAVAAMDVESYPAQVKIG